MRDESISALEFEVKRLVNILHEIGKISSEKMKDFVFKVNEKENTVIMFDSLVVVKSGQVRKYLSKLITTLRVEIITPVGEKSKYLCDLENETKDCLERVVDVDDIDVDDVVIERIDSDLSSRLK